MVVNQKGRRWLLENIDITEKELNILVFGGSSTLYVGLAFPKTSDGYLLVKAANRRVSSRVLQAIFPIGTEEVVEVTLD